MSVSERGWTLCKGARGIRRLYKGPSAHLARNLGRVGEVRDLEGDDLHPRHVDLVLQPLSQLCETEGRGDGKRERETGLIGRVGPLLRLDLPPLCAAAAAAETSTEMERGGFNKVGAKGRPGPACRHCLSLLWGWMGVDNEKI